MGDHRITLFPPDEPTVNVAPEIPAIRALHRRTRQFVYPTVPGVDQDPSVPIAIPKLYDSFKFRDVVDLRPPPVVRRRVIIVVVQGVRNATMIYAFGKRSLDFRLHRPCFASAAGSEASGQCLGSTAAMDPHKLLTGLRSGRPCDNCRKASLVARGRQSTGISSRIVPACVRFCRPIGS